MTEEEKGIKEIRGLIGKNCKACKSEYCDDCDWEDMVSELIYKAGYRKTANEKEAEKAIYERAKSTIEYRIDCLKTDIKSTLSIYNDELNEYKEQLDELRQSLDDLAKEYENELKK